MNCIEQAMTEYWGERCDDYEQGCPACDAWGEYDRIAKHEELLTNIMVAMAQDRDVLRIMTTKKSMADAVVAMRHLWE